MGLLGDIVNGAGDLFTGNLLGLGKQVVSGIGDISNGNWGMGSSGNSTGNPIQDAVNSVANKSTGGGGGSNTNLLMQLLGLSPNSGNSQAISNILNSAGKGLGGVAQADASNRGTKIATTLAANNQQLAEQQQRNQDLASLPGQIIRANYIAGGGYKPVTNYSSNGKVIPHFDLGLAPLTSADQAAGASLSKQLTDRLNTAPTYKDATQYMNPSATETALNWASPIATALGSNGSQSNTSALLAELLKQSSPNTQLPSAVAVNSNGSTNPYTPIPITGTISNQPQNPNTPFGGDNGLG